jgi:hypothetical protein
MRLDDSAIFLDVHSHVGVGEAMCCPGGRCFRVDDSAHSARGSYAVHYVDRAMLRSLILTEKKGRHPLY